MTEEKEERKISEKQIKLIIFLVLIIVVIGILLWGMVPSKIYEVSEILENPTEFQNIEVSVKGEVSGWALTTNFTLVDSNNNVQTLSVNYNGTFPEGFTNNETVVVDGVFTYTGGQGHIEAQAIKIGCPSKY